MRIEAGRNIFAVARSCGSAIPRQSTAQQTARVRRRPAGGADCCRVPRRHPCRPSRALPSSAWNEDRCAQCAKPARGRKEFRRKREIESVKSSASRSTADIAEPRDALRSEHVNPMHAEDREDNAKRAAAQGEQDTFGEQLADDAARAGAERGSHGNFLLPRDGARQLEDSQRSRRQSAARTRRRRAESGACGARRRPLVPAAERCRTSVRRSADIAAG